MSYRLKKLLPVESPEDLLDRVNILTRIINGLDLQYHNSDADFAIDMAGFTDLWDREEGDEWKDGRTP